MSQAATAWRLTALTAMSVLAITAQTPGSSASSASAEWRRLGPSSIDLHLAGPATGSVASLWYSGDGGTLFVRTESGRVLQTADFETWSKATGSRPETAVPAAPIRLPESSSKIVEASGDAHRSWALGHGLFVSEDNGASWQTVANEPVIGSGQNDVAVNPRDPLEIAVANDSGVWRTHDGGLSWASLNENLPNLPVARILSTRRGAYQTVLEDGRTLQLNDTHAPWTLADSRNPLAVEARDRDRVGRALGVEVSAIARSGEYAYAGSSDGRVWVSRDRGANWNPPQTVGSGAIQRFYVDSGAPRAALAVLSGTRTRVARTVDSGDVWDDVTSDLPDTPVHAAAADLASGAVIVATDRGVYMAHIDLNASTPPSSWTLLSTGLPASKVVDVAFSSNGTQAFAALEGYGVYTAPLSTRSGALRLINAADFSTRAAAPGSVVSVLGGKVTAASAGALSFPVLAAGASESQLQVPFEAGANTFDLAIRTGDEALTLPLTVHSVSPAIFLDRDGSPFLVDADTGLALDASTLLPPHARVLLMATGLGRVQPDWPAGVPAPANNPPAVVAGVEAYLDGVPLRVTSATLAPGYIGYYLVEVQMPAVLNDGPAELYLAADGEPSNKVRVRVANP